MEVAALKRKIKSLQKQNVQLKQKNEDIMTGLKVVFNKDQVQSLSRLSNCGSTWSPDTVKKCLQLHFACGSTGYNLMLAQGHPMPAERTLRERMQGIKFEPGILTEVFEMMHCKVSSFNTHQRKCVLMVDEMQLHDKLEYDPSTQSVCGYATLKENESDEPVLATHGLVFMIGGISTRWKQVVAYDFTGSSFSGSRCADIIKGIIQQCAAIGLEVIAVTSDMGSGNRAMWRDFGISAGRGSPVLCSASNPQDLSQPIFFLADVPHIVKNLRNHLCRGQLIHLPPDIVAKLEFPCDIVGLWPVKQLIAHEKGKQFKMAPNLTDTHISPGHFEKMKVSYAVQLMSHSTACALEELVRQRLLSPIALTTAWFFKQVNRWFDLMCSRHPCLALSMQRPDKHAEAVNFLESFIDMFSRIRIGDGSWKPVQTGVLISTKSILGLQRRLLVEDGFSFLLTSRFTQDSLENLFSMIRLKNPIPTPYQCKIALRVISVSQYLKAPKHGSYSTDDGAFFLADYRAAVQPELVAVLEDPESSEPDFDLQLDGPEKSAFAYMAGYIVTRVVNSNGCITCKDVIVDPNNSSAALDFTRLKCYTEGALTMPSAKVLRLFEICEKVFLANQVALRKPQSTDILVKKMAAASAGIDFPSCHGAKQNLTRRFVVLRIRIHLKEESRLQRAKEKAKLASRKFASASTSKK